MIRSPLIRALTEYARLPGTTYRTMHERKAREEGKAREHACSIESCDKRASDWAWTHTGPTRTGLVDGAPRTWGTDTGSYIPLCRSHHARFDAEARRREHVT